MRHTELSEQNFRRISWINILLTPPLLALFAWPYHVMAELLSMHEQLLLAGMVLFSLPFTLTILHGHITIALGALHRTEYHEWLKKRHWNFGLLMRPIFFSTRLRLVLLLLSLVLFAAGALL